MIKHPNTSLFPFLNLQSEDCVQFECEAGINTLYIRYVNKVMHAAPMQMTLSLKRGASGGVVLF